MKSLKKQEKGFTIIEVLIVLAIAGLIILIVFLAVPALQRNSRNTQRKNDVSALAGAVQEQLNNNNGDLSKVGAASNITSKVKLSNFDPANVAVDTTKTSAAAVPAPALENVTIQNYAKCQDAQTSGTTGATKRNIVIMYNVESGTSGAAVPQCQDI